MRRAVITLMNKWSCPDFMGMENEETVSSHKKHGTVTPHCDPDADPVYILINKEEKTEDPAETKSERKPKEEAEDWVLALLRRFSVENNSTTASDPCPFTGHHLSACPLRLHAPSGRFHQKTLKTRGPVRFCGGMVC